MAIRINNNGMNGTVIDAKRWCRQEIKKIQADISDEYMQVASDAIRKTLMRLPEYRNAGTVMMYVNVGKEVITRTMMDAANRQKKTVGLPLCVDTEKHLMEARLWSADYRLQVGAYGIPEPNHEAPNLSPGQIDLVILPCVSCDVECNRLGHGAGYYDRYLEMLRADCVKIALCYEKLLAEKVPTESHDRKVDMVITEENIYRSK